MNLRIFCAALLAVATGALWAYAATATATVITTEGGSVYTSTIKAESEGATSLDGSFTTIACGKSTIEGKVESHGKEVTAGGKISTLDFSECNFPTKVVKAGSLEAHATSEGDGTLTSTGAEISVETSVGTCIFTTNSTSIGTLTGSFTTLGNATLDINSSKIPRTGGSFLCGSSGTWTGSYKFTTPSVLLVGPEAEALSGMTVTPDPVEIPGELKTETAKVENSGTVELKGVKVSVADTFTKEFKESKTCEAGKNLAAKASCKETFECLAGAKGKEGYFFAGAKTPLIVITTDIKCK
jgi:hypothetical protein